MSKIKINIQGVAAELSLGNYTPIDKTIFNNWEDFYKYNDILHVSQFIADHISEIEIIIDGKIHYKGTVPARQFIKDKSTLPLMKENNLYLRTECVENATFSIETEIDDFDFNKLVFITQDHDLIFKSASEFVTSIVYDNKVLEMEWVKGEPIGNICLLCGYQNGFLLPIYDAVKKVYANNNLN